MARVFVDEVALEELLWHLDIPYWHGEEGQFTVTPNLVLSQPKKHTEHHQKIMSADISKPITLIRNKGKWLIVDEPHALAKAKHMNLEKVKVRKVVKAELPKVRRLEQEGLPKI